MKKYYVYNDDIGTWSTKAYTAKEILAKFGKGKVTVLPITSDGVVEYSCVFDPETEAETADIENDIAQAQEEANRVTTNGEKVPDGESGHQAHVPHEGFSNLSSLSPTLLCTATYRIQGQMQDEWSDPMPFSKACKACASNPNAIVWATIEGGDSYYEYFSSFTAAIKAGSKRIILPPPDLLITATYRLQDQMQGEWSEPMSYSKARKAYASNSNALVWATIEGGDSYFGTISSFITAIKAGNKQIILPPPVLLFTATYRILGEKPGEWGEPMSYSKACRACAYNPSAVVRATIEGGDSYYGLFSSFTVAIKADTFNRKCINVTLTLLFMIQGISSTLAIRSLASQLSEYHSWESRPILYMDFTAALVVALAAVIGLIFAPGLNKDGKRNYVPLIVTVLISLILLLIGAP